MPKLKRLSCFSWFSVFLFLLASPVAASSGVHSGQDVAKIFFWIALLLLAARLSSLIERWHQPAVLGELVVGVILGNLSLLGWAYFDVIKNNEVIGFLSELGVVLLLFQIGLESNMQRMRQVGVRALLVAGVGVVVPFVLGTYIIGPWLLPNLSFNSYLFLGATLTATSVGITARVFRDLGKLQTPEAQIVLGAAVIDDVLGLIILAVVSAVVSVGSVSFGTISFITAKALLFLAAAIILGQIMAPRLSRALSRIHTGVGMKFTLAVVFALVFAYLAKLVDLAPIVGAFAAGLVLDAVHFRFFKDPAIVSDVCNLANEANIGLQEKLRGLVSHHALRHIEDLIEPLVLFLVPIFFVVTGMNVKLDVLFDLRIILVAAGITLFAIVGKIVSGLAAGKVNKLLVGFGMVPRGEVGLIFATIGRSLGVIDGEVFSVIIIVVIITTLLTPLILAWLLRRAPAAI